MEQLDDIISLYEQSNKNVSKRFMKNAISDLKTNKKLKIYTEFSDKLVGMVCYDTEQNEMKYLAVHPDFRNQGIGTKLIEKIIKKYPKFTFNCTGKNANALKFYSNFPELKETHRTTKKIFGHDFTLVYFQRLSKKRKRTE